MRIICDAHVHLYHCFKPETLIQNLAVNLEKTSKSDAKCAFLLLPNNSLTWKETVTDTFKQLPDMETKLNSNEESITLFKDKIPFLHLLPGKQIVTEEHIEILSLGTSENIANKLPAVETISLVENAGGLPVLSWSPGKWLFTRGKIVKKIIENHQTKKIFLCDTAIRPAAWPEPLPIKIAREKGISILAGSDQLPIAGDEKYAGTYGFIIDAPFNPSSPLTSMLEALSQNDPDIITAGRRNGLSTSAKRWLKHELRRSH